MTTSPCPVCQSVSSLPMTIREGLFRCPDCLHSFLDSPEISYVGKKGRNRHNRFQGNKIESRYRFLEPCLESSMCILEVGCAEGDLGRSILEHHPGIVYDGIEPSLDALIAQGALSHVFNCSYEAMEPAKPYDMVVMFHVLEHMKEPGAVLAFANTNSVAKGLLVLEVPHGVSGSSLIPVDYNPEHLQFFSPTSLSRIIEEAGFQVLAMETRAMESPVYNDCIRVLATKRVGLDQKIEDYKQVLFKYLGDKFSIYAVGGDFEQHVRPYIQQDHVRYLFDKDHGKNGQVLLGHEVKDPEFLKENQDVGRILISSIDYGLEIYEDLIRRFRINKELIVKLEDILNNAGNPSA